MPQHIFNSNICRILFATCLSALCLIALSTQAATITVTKTNDSSAGSLRQALADAVDGDTINFDSLLNGQTITLTTGELLVNKNVTLNGPGSDHLIVDGNHASRVFHVSGGVTATIAGLTITNGSASDWGGGIHNDQSVLTVNNCNIVGNFAPGWGGGIFNDSFVTSATLRVTNSTLSGNSAGSIGTGTGGGIYSEGSYGNATMEIVNSTVSSNSARAGGGIYNSHSASTVSNCTISGNSASYGGGGIFHVGINGSATLSVTNSTLSGNSAPLGAGIYSYGHSSTTLDVLNSTFSVNGIINVFATLRVGSTIFDASWVDNESGTTNSLGYNLSSDDGGGSLTATGDQINTDPMLGPLQDNGGPTFTHALLTGSPAIDAGDPNFDPNAFNPPMLYDQRGSGYSRVAHGRIDIGAFEIVVPSYAGQVQPPINADGTSVFNSRRGVVPVRFNLTLGGVATCDLPPATIAVTRTAGGVIGQVNESDYSGNADTGSNFRIGSCQYVYNLNARALGVGTYRIDILIDGQVIGSASFELR